MRLRLGWILLIDLIVAQTANFSKRGIAYLGTDHSSDYNLFLSHTSPLTWYYNWSPNPIPGFGHIEFVPLLHGTDNLDDDISTISTLPKSSTHLLTFNEPDGSLSSGGSAISPSDAASAYVSSIAPLSIQNGGKWYISWPSTTGTYDSGLPWLAAFNASCYQLNRTHGCVADFAATHWYGGFPGLAAWLGTLDEFFNTNASMGLEIWVTELALPQADAQTTGTMMNQTLPYLDGLPYAGRYAWYGLFRDNVNSSWTGDGVALLDGSGRLTELGAVYLGGNATGFYEGERASESNSGAVEMRPEALALLLAVTVGIVFVNIQRDKI